MTVSSSTNRASYSGNGSLTTFAYGFKVFDQGDLTVILRAANGTETVQTITTDYTVTGVGDVGGGNVVFTTAPASGVTVVILREMDLEQGLDLVPNDPFPAQSLENSLDKLTFMVQQHNEELGRAIKASRTNVLSGSEFVISAADRANKVFSFDGSGNLAVTQELGTFQGNWATATVYKVRDLVKDTSTNNIFLVNSEHTSSGAQPLTTNANSAKYDLIVDAAAAATSATAAAASESAAETAQTAAEAAQAAAETAETNAETAETNAETAQAAAEAAQAAAELVYDNFDDRYLGAKSTGSGDPTVDNDGDALIDGALFFDTTNNVTKVYNLGTTTWLRTTPTTSDQTNINTVSGIQANVTTVAGISSDITEIAGISTQITTVANGFDTGNLNFTGTATISSDLTVGGNLQVNGTTTTINSTTMDVDDLNITVASGAASAAAADGGGITIDGANIALAYDHSDSVFDINYNFRVSGALSTVNSGGAVNIFEATDSLDSLVQFANSTTGKLSGDGFKVGINGSEEALLFNYEATDMQLATSGAVRMRLGGSGNVLIESGNAVRFIGSTDSLYTAISRANPSGANTATLQDKSGTIVLEDGSGNLFLNDDTALLSPQTGSTSSTSQTSIATFAHASWNAAKGIITANDGTDTHITELLIAHDGTTAIATEYGTIHTSTAALATYDVDISGSDVRILATAAAATATSYTIVLTLT